MSSEVPYNYAESKEVASGVERRMCITLEMGIQFRGRNSKITVASDDRSAATELMNAICEVVTKMGSKSNGTAKKT